MTFSIMAECHYDECHFQALYVECRSALSLSLLVPGVGFKPIILVLQAKRFTTMQQGHNHLSKAIEIPIASTLSAPHWLEAHKELLDVASEVRSRGPSSVSTRLVDRPRNVSRHAAFVGAFAFMMETVLNSQFFTLFFDKLRSLFSTR